MKAAIDLEHTKRLVAEKGDSVPAWNAYRSHATAQLPAYVEAVEALCELLLQVYPWVDAAPMTNQRIVEFALVCKAESEGE